MSADREAAIREAGERIHELQALLRDATDTLFATRAETRELRETMEYVEGVLSREPFDETQRAFAAGLLRAALSELAAAREDREQLLRESDSLLRHEARYEAEIHGLREVLREIAAEASDEWASKIARDVLERSWLDALSEGEG